ncbi:hydrogenase large subunit [Amnibacterium sp.]|uniref:hydrogenase large subunit n=1 Tax=Amnibacterium sp. TaxID=1872496 RepID=UPI003F7C5C74
MLEAVGSGARFAGLFGTAEGAACRVTALLAAGETVRSESVTVLPDGTGRLIYPALTPDLPPAFWWERALHDLSGVVAAGHPRLDALLLPRSASGPPRPGGAAFSRWAGPAEAHGPVDVSGGGVFVLPVGPVRSGVVESIEFLLETPGEDVPHLNIRPHFKHRGVAKRFEGLQPADGVLVAERVEGVASVAHALAFCHAVEAVSGAVVPPRAALIRVIHAELERIANHLDVAMRLAEAAGLAVAQSRFGWHKEAVLRLRSELCGSRFGRGVVVPGGVAADLGVPPHEAATRLGAILARITDDGRRAGRSPSFLDRLRGTGRLSTDYARTWALVGPVARGSGVPVDARWDRPTDGYDRLTKPNRPSVREAGDVQARMEVRWAEIEVAGEFALDALARLARDAEPALRGAAEDPAGERSGIGWAEAPHGEVLCALTVVGARIMRCFVRTPSLTNLVAFHDAFPADVFTDFAFIEASFGLSYAGVAM